MFKNVNILEFGDYIWNHHDKYLQISTNMPDICLKVLKCWTFCKQNDFVLMVKPMAACTVL